MKPSQKKVAHKCLIQFDKGFSNIEDLRTEISSSLATEDNLWLSYDEDAGIERLKSTKNGYGYHKHYELFDFFDLPSGEGEADMEALAYQEPFLWFCGSMSLKRNSPNERDPIDKQLGNLSEIATDANRFSLGCIPCIKKDGSYELLKEAEYNGEKIKPLMLRGGTKSTELHNALMTDEHLKKFMTIPCKDNGFDIEGLAIFEERIFIGLRGPVLNGYAVILEISCKQFDNELILSKKPDEDKLYRKHFIDLSGMGIRELNITKNGDLFLLAGPTMDLDGTISIYKIKGGLPDQHGSVIHQPERLFDVARGAELEHGADKAEGMAFLPDGKVLITYDSPVPERLEGETAVWMDCYDID
ncbi:DUF3616 domain-containing protein [Christiangramia sp. SM2212]|uniref:DUF3616 domain-containing protein n=1 Tax=Christiangramia sediminicola TaxID=3073267 RepID=A0ABU1EPQ6_9FLAO|nr:DUF3616 domain-containing protein [Christiangramia sp. SM2212]MDR5590362.1 DUF3616 domain-containing protein [Christiangramia sp. SM2212]